MKKIFFSVMLLATTALGLTDIYAPNMPPFTDTIEATGGENCTTAINLSSGINLLTVSTTNQTFTGVIFVKLAHQSNGTYVTQNAGSDWNIDGEVDRAAVIEVGTSGYNFAKVCGDVAVSDVLVYVYGSRISGNIIQKISEPVYTVNDFDSLNNSLFFDILNQIGITNSSWVPVTLTGGSRINEGVTGTLASSSTTANQVVAGITDASKSFHVVHWDISARLTTYATTATLFGECSLESPAGTKLSTVQIANAGDARPVSQSFSVPIIIPVNTVVRVVCTPAATTAFTWRANIIGYAKP